MSGVASNHLVEQLRLGVGKIPRVPHPQRIFRRQRGRAQHGHPIPQRPRIIQPKHVEVPILRINRCIGPPRYFAGRRGRHQAHRVRVVQKDPPIAREQPWLHAVRPPRPTSAIVFILVHAVHGVVRVAVQRGKPRAIKDGVCARRGVPGNARRRRRHAQVGGGEWRGRAVREPHRQRAGGQCGGGGVHGAHVEAKGLPARGSREGRPVVKARERVEFEAEEGGRVGAHAVGSQHDGLRATNPTKQQEVGDCSPHCRVLAALPQRGRNQGPLP